MFTFARYFTVYLVFGYTFTYTVFDVFPIEGFIVSALYLCVIWISGFLFRQPVINSYCCDHLVMVSSIIRTCLYVSFSAWIFIIIDRYIIFGSDLFSMGTARLRVEKNEYGSSGTIFSLIGNLFAYTYFIALYLFVAFYKVISRQTVKINLALFLMLLLLSVYFTGGRTPLILAILSVLAGFSFNRGFIHDSLSFNKISASKVVILIILAVFSFGYIFYLRSVAFNSGDSFMYVTNMCFHLTSFDESLTESCASLGVDDLSVSIVRDIINYSIAILLYAFHGLWIANDIGITFIPTSESVISLAGITFLLRRFGFEFFSHDYVGYFVPFYSSVFHDLGVIFSLPFLIGLPLVCRFLMTRQVTGINYYGVFYFFGFITIALSFFINPLNFPFYLLCLTGILIVVFLQIKGR